ncbi:carbon-nitrogen family hydrolase [Xylanibacillus composti]|uniref:Hydrolase n=1 Tax=Xylanibacillus composti TaxID=1572762 RepID=A0A8J4H2N9_9BACL|nr:carbon-nitrogen family hydrolase [Xylanibacillus composti]MDT9725519.1 carbon-nitrogen family hydrolase [Xylanibacillus composti]GIQ67613.1 hydrolase [Xylanibacillus composti]
MSEQLRIALVQMDIAIGEPDVNADKAIQLMEEAVRSADKPDVIVLPEMWNTGYALERIHELGDEGGTRTRNIISAFCRKHAVNVVAGSVAELKDGQAFNTSYVFNREGQVLVDYSKIHLFRLMDEEKHLAEGTKPGRFAIEGQDAGVMICYDIRFPELARKLALDGVKLLFVPAEWPNPRLHHWRTLLQARAIENQMYIVACNRVGTSGDTDFFGHSMIVDPWGEIVVEGGEEEAILQADIDLNLVNEVRGRIPVFEDRRPSLYG